MVKNFSQSHFVLSAVLHHKKHTQGSDIYLFDIFPVQVAGRIRKVKLVIHELVVNKNIAPADAEQYAMTVKNDIQTYYGKYYRKNKWIPGPLVHHFVVNVKYAEAHDGEAHNGVEDFQGDGHVMKFVQVDAELFHGWKGWVFQC